MPTDEYCLYESADREIDGQSSNNITITMEEEEENLAR